MIAELLLLDVGLVDVMVDMIGIIFWEADLKNHRFHQIEIDSSCPRQISV